MPGTTRERLTQGQRADIATLAAVGLRPIDIAALIGLSTNTIDGVLNTRYSFHHGWIDLMERERWLFRRGLIP